MRYGHSGREPVYWCSPAGEETDHPREVIEAALAHVVRNRVEAAYARSDLFERRRILMNDWSRYLAYPNTLKTATTPIFVSETAGLAACGEPPKEAENRCQQGRKTRRRRASNIESEETDPRA